MDFSKPRGYFLFFPLGVNRLMLLAQLCPQLLRIPSPIGGGEHGFQGIRGSPARPMVVKRWSRVSWLMWQNTSMGS